MKLYINYILLQESLQALAFYRNLKVDDKRVVDEMNILKRNINPSVDNEVQSMQTGTLFLHS